MLNFLRFYCLFDLCVGCVLCVVCSWEWIKIIIVGDAGVQGYQKMLDKLNLRRDKAVKVQKSTKMASSESSKDKRVNFSEWRNDLMQYDAWYHPIVIVIALETRTN